MSPAGQWALAGARVFDGAELHDDHAILIDGERIAAVVPRADLPRIRVQEADAGAWLAPGLIDVQVNGGGDVLFNDSPTVETIATIAAAHARLGTTSILPTLITDTTDKMREGARAAEKAARKVPGALGIHFEGPLLSPDRPGVHDPRLIRAPRDGDLDLLTSLRQGVTLVTLAPERVPAGFIEALAQAGVRVALGHSNATFAETVAAIGEGLTGFTHLYNAMRPLASRDPGPIAAALERDDVWIGLIVDGIHVEPAMLKLALRGLARPMLVSDAMPPVGGKRDSFTLYGETIAVRDGSCVRGDGALAGAAISLADAVRNCVTMLGLDLKDALRAASTEPAAFLGLDRVGRLAKGCRADIIAVDPKAVAVLETWVAGQRVA